MKETINILLVASKGEDFRWLQQKFGKIKHYIISLECLSTFSEAQKEIFRFEHDAYYIFEDLDSGSGKELIQRAVTQGCLKPLILVSEDSTLQLNDISSGEVVVDVLTRKQIDEVTLEKSLAFLLQRSKTLDKLIRNEYKYKSLFDQSLDYIFIANDEMVLTDINAALKEEVKLSVSEGRIPLRSLFFLESQYDDFIKSLHEFKKVRGLEIKLATAEKKSVDCLINASLLYSKEGVFYGIHGIIHNIDERKKAEKELLIAEKLTSSGRLARALAHEVRNPLTNLQLSLDQLNSSESLTSEDQPFLEIIQRNTRRIGELITEILESSRQSVLDLSQTSLFELIDQSIELVQDRLKLQEVHYRQQLPKDDILLHADVDKLKMALVNLLINAIEAVEKPGGAIFLNVDVLGTDRIQISIEDNGVGISDENLDKLFDPYYTEKGKGMGLGLTSVKNIINAHQGKIQVESTLGEGTRFDLILPRSN